MMRSPLAQPLVEQQSDQHRNELLELGYTVVTLNDTSPVCDIRNFVYRRIAQFFGQDYEEGTLSLPQDPQFAELDDRYLSLLRDLNAPPIHPTVVARTCEPLKPLITSLLGENIAVQTVPHVRLVRANESIGLLPMHSDTFYGNSFFDLNLWIPLTTATEHDAPGLGVLPSTHLPRHGTVVTKDVPGILTILERRQGIPIPYSPKTIDFKPEHVLPLFIPYGSLLLFFGSLQHVSLNHTRPFPRISVDLRVTPLLLPHAFRKTRPGYFSSLWATELTERILRCYPHGDAGYL